MLPTAPLLVQEILQQTSDTTGLSFIFGKLLDSDKDLLQHAVPAPLRRVEALRTRSQKHTENLESHRGRYAQQLFGAIEDDPGVCQLEAQQVSQKLGVSKHRRLSTQQLLLAGLLLCSSIQGAVEAHPALFDQRSLEVHAHPSLFEISLELGAEIGIEVHETVLCRGLCKDLAGHDFHHLGVQMLLYTDSPKLGVERLETFPSEFVQDRFHLPLRPLRDRHSGFASTWHVRCPIRTCCSWYERCTMFAGTKPSRNRVPIDAGHRLLRHDRANLHA
mmetsp:Transcript_25928/g.67999  ORF Transcript_25928/g.67999 Transcript_25928/m.67999 type:complete len:275 (-) Transcript_25928:446-1270(-)